MTFPRYPHYKDSRLEWLGEVPEHWVVERVKSLASFNDEVLPESTPGDYEIEYVDISGVDATAGITTKESMSFASAPSRARRRVRNGDAIVSTVRTYLRAIAAIRDPEENLIVSTGFAVIRPRGRLDSSFIAYLLRSAYFVEQVIARSTGVSYPAINASDIATIPVAVPPIDEQITIARLLDIETAKLDALIAEQRRLIELLNEKRQAVISHAVTKGLNPNAPLKPSGVEWLGDVPAHWSVAPVASRFSVQLGKMLDSSRITGANLRPYLRVADVQWGRVSAEDLPHMDFSIADKRKFRLEPGDLLVNEGGSYPGRSAVWLGQIAECYYQKALHRLRPLRSDNDSAQFFYYVMHWAANGGVFIAGGNETTIEHLPAEKLRRYRFAFPPFHEQKAIVSFLDGELARLADLDGEAMRATALLEERRSAFISAAVTGRIDIRKADRRLSA